MRSTKDQLVEKDVLMPVKHNVFLWNLPDVEEMPSHDGETILLWSPWKYRCGQRTVRMAVRGMQPKAKHSLRAQAQLMRTETVETFELVKVKQKLLDIRAEKEQRKKERESDEAHFWLNGYINKQNCRIWSEANPQVYVETPLHPEKLTVWCALWAGGIIGPYFFKNDEGLNVTVNSDRYRAMITNFFIPELNNHDVQELWFQQDGTTCHTARAPIDLLKDTFGDRLTSRFGPVN
ncbi:uncharacterized protein TNCV_1649251 [Trichonephila clavipes]|nr:uncharacterized protein TNCV_1649251 [Trichonephila clavipes]